MGFRGKLAEREEARRLRAQSWTLLDIASWLGVAKSSVSEWVRDVEFEPSPRRTGARTRPNALRERKLAEIERLNAEGVVRIGTLSEREFLVTGLALYAGEGAKTDGLVRFTNTSPELVAFYCRWLRRFFEPSESRLRAHVQLHEGLDLSAAEAFWSEVTGIPLTQFTAPQRPKPRESRRFTKQRYGCVYVDYSCSRTHRAVMGLIRALLTSQSSNPG